MDEKSRNIYIGDAIGDKIADHTFLPPFMAPFWDTESFFSSVNKLKQIDYDSVCMAHFGYFHGDEAKHILDEGLQVFETWWQLFDNNADKLADIDYMLEAILKEINPEAPDLKIISLKLKVLFALLTSWRKLSRKADQPISGLLFRGIFRQLAEGYRTYKKLS